MKSDISKINQFHNPNLTHHLQQNITEEEEDSQDEGVSSDNESKHNYKIKDRTNANNLSKDSKETTTTQGKEWD